MGNTWETKQSGEQTNKTQVIRIQTEYKTRGETQMTSKMKRRNTDSENSSQEDKISVKNVLNKYQIKGSLSGH